MIRISFTTVVLAASLIVGPSLATANSDDLAVALKATAQEALNKADEGKKELSPKAQIKMLYKVLIQEFGVERRLEIAEAIAVLFPEEKEYVAKRALYYSPMKSKELAQRVGLSSKGISNTFQSVLPSQATLTSAGTVRPGRTFNLPQVEERRRVLSETDSNGRIIKLTGTVGGGGGGGGFTATLGPVVDNGFTEDGLGYTVRDGNGDLIGIYLGLTIDPTDPDIYTFGFKCIHQGVPPGSGGSQVIVDISTP